MKQFVKKYNALQTASSKVRGFRIGLRGERISVPATVIINIEH